MADPWPYYRAAHVDIEFEGGRLTYTPGGVVALPEGVRAPLWIITACNPGGQRREEAVNAEQNEHLRQAVSAAGWRCWPAVGRNAEATWTETSFAVEGAPPEEVLKLARRFGQDAVFRLDARGLDVLPAG